MSPYTFEALIEENAALRAEAAAWKRAARAAEELEGVWRRRWMAQDKPTTPVLVIRALQDELDAMRTVMRVCDEARKPRRRMAEAADGQR